MSWGDAFNAAWDKADEAKRAAAGALATGAKKAQEAAELAAEKVKEAEAVAKETQKIAEAASKKVTETETLAKEAQEFAEAAAKKAQEIQALAATSNSPEIQAAAKKVQELAEEAAKKAEEIQATLKKAKEFSDATAKKAEEIQSALNKAQEFAKAASKTAKELEAAAKKVQETHSTAKDAQEFVDAAIEKAKKIKATAENAKKLAEAAGKTAEDVQAAAKEAQKFAEDAAKIAKGIEDAAAIINNKEIQAAAKKARELAEAAAKKAEEIQAAAKKAQELAEAAAKKVEEIEAAVKKAKETIELAKKKAKETSDWVKEKTDEVEKWSKNPILETKKISKIVKKAYENVKKKFKDIVAGAIKIACELLGPSKQPTTTDENFSPKKLKKIIGQKIKGENSSSLKKAMETLWKNRNSSPPPNVAVQKALQTVAKERGVPLKKIQEDWERYQALIKEQQKIRKANGQEDVPEINNFMHPDFMASTSQLRSGKVVGDALGVDPVFGSLLNPTGGLVGPGNASYDGNDSAIGYHGAVHDAAGYLKNYHNKGPGYDYLGSDDRDTTDPLSGQRNGIRFWRDQLGASSSTKDLAGEVGMKVLVGTIDATSSAWDNITKPFK